MLLQIFWVLNVLVIGAVATLAVQHYLAHKHQSESPEKPKANVPALPPELKEQLIKESQEKFQAALNHLVEGLQKDLETTAADLNKQLTSGGIETIGEELKRYREELSALHQQANSAVGDYQKEITEYQAELRQTLATEAENERSFIRQQLDAKLSDAVVAFLLETLQHNVDLGAQGPYLTAMLEEHKADLLQEITGESKAAK
jgi:hypothetical protein